MAGSAYKNMGADRFEEEAKKTGKPYRIVYLTESGGSYGMIGETLKAAREVLLEISSMRRSPCPLSSLTLGVKCGTSDATSGIAGNPTVGAVFDALVAAGGTAFFSETTEIIGAEDLVAARGRTPAVSQALELTYQPAFAASQPMTFVVRRGADEVQLGPVPASPAEVGSVVDL